MILEQDSLLNFNYDTTTHILTVSYPNLTGIAIPQIENSLDKLCRNVVNYDIKKMVLDLRTGVLGVNEAHYFEMLNKFLTDLSHSHLEKVARVIPENPAREYLVKHYLQVMRSDLNVNFEDRTFATIEDAEAWLLKDQRR